MQQLAVVGQNIGPLLPTGQLAVWRSDTPRKHATPTAQSAGSLLQTFSDGKTIIISMLQHDCFLRACKAA